VAIARSAIFMVLRGTVSGSAPGRALRMTNSRRGRSVRAPTIAGLAVAFFSRRRLEKSDLDWLRVFADHAAVAIANARAFEEIAQRKESAERERDYLREAGPHGAHSERPEDTDDGAGTQLPASFDASELPVDSGGCDCSSPGRLRKA